jgi:hypothetical protein
MFYTGNSVQAVPLHQLQQFPDVIGMASALHLFSLQLIGFTLWITERERDPLSSTIAKQSSSEYMTNQVHAEQICFKISALTTHNAHDQMSNLQLHLQLQRAFLADPVKL